jgi:pimeloyl-ACP methyl ester carboxylesterase
MATYVLIHGAASDSWYWHRVIPLLQARGHTVVAPTVPTEDDSAGLAEYADVAFHAIVERSTRPKPLILVAQSMGGFTAPLVTQRVPVDLIVLLNAMIPLPHEPGEDWWRNTGHPEARREQAERLGRPRDAKFDASWDFFHDVPKDVVDVAFARGERRQSSTPFEKPWPLAGWPDVPTRFLLCRDDRFFPADFMREVVRDRLGIIPDEMPGGHLVALSRPEELVERLEAIRLDELNGPQYAAPIAATAPERSSKLPR